MKLLTLIGLIAPLFLLSPLAQSFEGPENFKGISQEVFSQKMEKKFGKIRSMDYRYCPGFSLLVLQRASSLQFFSAKVTNHPLQLALEISGQSMAVAIDDKKEELYDIRIKPNDNPGVSGLNLFTLDRAGEADLAGIEVLDQQFKFRYRYSCHLGPQGIQHDDTHVYQFPFEKGEPRYVINGHGDYWNQEANHFGVAWRMAEGTDVLAARDGKIIAVEDSIEMNPIPSYRWENERNYVFVLHDDGSVARYMNLKQNSVSLKEGAQVVVGQKIGESGRSGLTGTAHLYFDVKIPRDSVNFAVPTGLRDWQNSISTPIKLQTSTGVVTDVLSHQNHY